MLAEILIIGLILTSLVLVVLGILSIKEIFVNKYFLFVTVLTAMFFAATVIVNAQEKPEGRNKTMIMQQEDMAKCMDKIAASSTMRMQMMDQMMQHTKDDTTGMMQMCKMMMDNFEMHKMMMKMMQGEGMMDGMMKHNMKDDSTKNSGHKSHH